MDINKAYLYQKRGTNRVNLNPVNWGYLSTDDQWEGNDSWAKSSTAIPGYSLTDKKTHLQVCLAIK